MNEGADQERGMEPIYRFENVGKSFEAGGERLEIFSGLNLEVPPAQSLAILGASGSGKSTLLHLMGALDKPSSGRIFYKGKALDSLSPAGQAAFRNKSLGFVFQFHHLLPEFTALENVAMPGLIAGRSRAEAEKEAKELLLRVGLGGRLDRRQATLSGGERQRAAIARALLMRPAVILADEPTGNLDENTGRQVGDLLFELNRELGMAMVVVTHNRDLAARMDRSLELRAGALYEKVFT